MVVAKRNCQRPRQKVRRDVVWGAIVHNGVAFVYVALRGHYFRRSERGNVVTRSIEANNYWNMASMLYCANCILLPVIKLSFAGTHSMRPAAATTPLIDLCDMLGAIVTLSYSFAVWM